MPINETSIVASINSAVVASPVLKTLTILGATYLIIPMAVLMLYSGWRKRMLLVGFVAVAILFVANYSIAHGIYFRARPSGPGITHLIAPHSSKSFPSDHAGIVAVLAVLAYSIDLRLGAGMTLLGFVVGLSRVAAGVHFPSDILGGYFIGALAGWLARWFVL